MRLLPLIALMACAPPDSAETFVQLNARTFTAEAQVNDAFIELIQSADDELSIALPQITDTRLSDAIIAKHAEGVLVRVVTDIDQATDPGTRALQDAGVPLRLADGDITYFDFILGNEVSWTSDQVIMSHAFVVSDNYRTITATTAGGQADTSVVVIDIQGQDIAQDLWLEHNQVFGGSDATALTAFSAPAKSRTDIRWRYPAQGDVPVEFWLGPQERLIKRTIDAIYTARISVRVLSNEMVNEGIARALQDKASWGFPVEAIIGPDFSTTSQALARVFQNNTPDVSKFRFNDAADMPTIILVDIEGGPDVLPRAYVLSHDLYSAERTYRGTEVITDQLIDGNLFVFSDTFYTGSEPQSPLQPLVDLYQDHLDRSGDF